MIRLRDVNPRRRVSLDMAETIVGFINKRVEDLCLGWDWPEWRVTEERAYRQVWHTPAQYKRVSDSTGLPDEVFYIPTMTYFKVLTSAPADPPIGTLPTDTTYWEALDHLDTYLEYEQPCKRPIGLVLGVYTGNPKLCSAPALNFSPGINGVDVYRAAGPTAFVLYQRPTPSYTFVPKEFGRSFTRGEITYDQVTGECYRALSTNMTDVSDTSVWRRVPFLSVWRNYVVYGAYADTLMSIDKDIPTSERLALAQGAEAIAQDAIQKTIDGQTREGQLLYWTFSRRRSCECESIKWTGGSVTTLTDSCDDEGAITPTFTLGVVSYYYANIVALKKTTASPALNEVVTTYLALRSIAKIVIDPYYPGQNYQSQEYRLMTGAADPDDPGQVQPLDYNSSFNNKHWEKID